MWPAGGGPKRTRPAALPPLDGGRLEAPRPTADESATSLPSTTPRTMPSTTPRRTGALPSLESPRRASGAGLTEPLPSLGTQLPPCRGSSPTGNNNMAPNATKHSLSPLGRDRPQVDPQASVSTMGPRSGAAFTARRRPAPGGAGTRLAPLGTPRQSQDVLPPMPGAAITDLRPSCPWEQGDAARPADELLDTGTNNIDPHDEGIDDQGMFIGAMAAEPVVVAPLYEADVAESQYGCVASAILDTDIVNEVNEGGRSAIESAGSQGDEPRSSSALDAQVQLERAVVERAVHDAFNEELDRGSSPTAAAADAIRKCCSSVSRESMQNARTPFFSESHRLLLKEGEDNFGVTV